jgi:hypothetical protein
MKGGPGNIVVFEEGMVSSLGRAESAPVTSGKGNSVIPSKGPPPWGISGTEIDGWLGGDFDRPHT